MPLRYPLFLLLSTPQITTDPRAIIFIIQNIYITTKENQKNIKEIYPVFPSLHPQDNS